MKNTFIFRTKFTLHLESIHLGQTLVWTKCLIQYQINMNIFIRSTQLQNNLRCLKKWLKLSIFFRKGVDQLAVLATLKSFFQSIHLCTLSCTSLLWRIVWWTYYNRDKDFALPSSITYELVWIIIRFRLLMLSSFVNASGSLSVFINASSLSLYLYALEICIMDQSIHAIIKHLFYYRCT